MSTDGFSKIAVIGAGTMGSGIASQIANAGHEVMLLDLPAREGADKSPAEMAIDRLMASDPPQLMHKRNAGRIVTGTISDDFGKLAECDWIIEAVVERLDIKKDLYARLDDTIGRCRARIGVAPARRRLRRRDARGTAYRLRELRPTRRQ